MYRHFPAWKHLTCVASNMYACACTGLYVCTVAAVTGACCMWEWLALPCRICGPCPRITRVGCLPFMWAVLCARLLTLSVSGSVVHVYVLEGCRVRRQLLWSLSMVPFSKYWANFYSSMLLPAAFSLSFKSCRLPLCYHWWFHSQGLLSREQQHAHHSICIEWEFAICGLVPRPSRGGGERRPGINCMHMRRYYVDFE